MNTREQRIHELLQHIGDLGAELLRPGGRPVPELKAEIEHARREIGLLLEGVSPESAAHGNGAPESAPLADRIAGLVDRRLKRRTS
jgi:hypothetical protein